MPQFHPHQRFETIMPVMNYDITIVTVYTNTPKSFNTKVEFDLNRN